jgi:hypothetical protein
MYINKYLFSINLFRERRITMATAREELHKIVDMLKDDDVLNLLPLLKKIITSDYEEEELTEEELKEIRELEAEIDRGEYVTLEDLKKDLKQLNM